MIVNFNITSLIGWFSTKQTCSPKFPLYLDYYLIPRESSYVIVFSQRCVSWYKILSTNRRDFFSCGNISCVIFLPAIVFLCKNTSFFTIYRNKLFESYFWCCFLVLHFLAKVHELPSGRLRATLTIRKFNVALNPLDRISLNFAKSRLATSRLRKYESKRLGIRRAGFEKVYAKFALNILVTIP